MLCSLLRLCECGSAPAGAICTPGTGTDLVGGGGGRGRRPARARVNEMEYLSYPRVIKLMAYQRQLDYRQHQEAGEQVLQVV